MEIGDLLIKGKRDIGIIFDEDKSNYSCYGQQYMVYWFKNKTCQALYRDIIKDMDDVTLLKPADFLQEGNNNE